MIKRVTRKPAPVPERPELADSMLWAAEWGQDETVFELMDKGAPVNARDKNGMSALHFLAMKSNAKAVERLIERGAEVNALSQEGMTPLHLAAVYSHKKTVETLCNKGADVNAQTGNGFTALHLTHRGGVARVLIAAGINTSLKDNTGRTALETAHAQNRRDVESAIINAVSLRNSKTVKHIVTQRNRRAA